MSALCDELFNAILMARQRVYAVSGATPLEEVAAADLPFRLFVKREDLGPIKAYKWRGAYNRMAMLSPEERSREIVAASAGNHAQGVALAAKLLDVHAKIFMPRSTPDVKQNAVKRFGGDKVEIVLFGDAYDEASRAAHETAARERLTFVHPYDDIGTMGGQGTLADECVLSGKGPFDVAFLQIGGGGMAAACACWLRRQYPDIKIYGVEGVGQASMKAAFEAGTPVNIGKADIFCDGTSVRQAGDLTFPLCRELMDDIVLVTNDDVCWAIQMLWETHRVVPETSGAMGVAAALKLAGTLAGKKVLTVISGANLDFGMLGVITRNSQVNGAHRRYLRVRIPERPGAWLKILDGIFSRYNLLELQYGKNDADIAWFTVGVAVSDAEFAVLAKKLDDEKIAWRHVTGDADVQFRVIPYNEKLMRRPAFLRLDFYERRGALADFLRTYLSASENICYFNYLYTGERVGRALIGIEFADVASRERFLKNLPSTGEAFRSCVVIDGPAAARLAGEEKSQ